MIEQQTSQDDKSLAALTHASGILFGFVMPLIVWLISKDTKPWLTAEAKAALNFQITVLIAEIISCLLMFVIIGMFLLPIVLIGNLVVCILAAIKASKGESYTYPFALALVK